MSVPTQSKPNNSFPIARFKAAIKRATPLFPLTVGSLRLVSWMIDKNAPLHFRLSTRMSTKSPQLSMPLEYKDLTNVSNLVKSREMSNATMTTIAWKITFSKLISNNIWLFYFFSGISSFQRFYNLVHYKRRLFKVTETCFDRWDVFISL